MKLGLKNMTQRARYKKSHSSKYDTKQTTTAECVMLDEKSTVCVFVIESMTALGYGRNEREMIEQRERTEYSYRWHRHIWKKMSLPSYWQNVTIKMNKVCVCVNVDGGKTQAPMKKCGQRIENERRKKRTRRKVNIRDSLLYETKIKSCKTHLTHIRLKRERTSEREKSDAHTLEPNICSILLFYHLRRTNWFWNTHRNNNDINGLAQLMMIEPFFGILLLPSATFYEALILLSSFSFRCKRSRQRYEPEKKKKRHKRVMRFLFAMQFMKRSCTTCVCIPCKRDNWKCWANELSSVAFISCQKCLWYKRLSLRPSKLRQHQ